MGSLTIDVDLDGRNYSLLELLNADRLRTNGPDLTQADLDTQQDAARRARGEAEHAGHIMKKHLSSTSAGVVSQIQQEQVCLALPLSGIQCECTEGRLVFLTISDVLECSGWQDLVHRLKDLQTAATEQLQISENLEKERDELIGRLQEANDDNHRMRQVGMNIA